MSGKHVLEVRSLTVSVGLPDGRRARVVDNVSFAIPPGGALGLVGESGSGKTMTSLAIMGLLPPGVRIDSGEIFLEGENILHKSPREMQGLRGRRMAMVLQDPLTALDPVYTIRSQLAEPLRQHRGLRGEALERALVDALERVQLPASRERLNQYPHQLSGGMRQRVTSAIALAGEPTLLIADEPTSALDATTQARYLELLKELQKSTGFALLLIAHDLFVVRDVCERVIVMYSSQAMEDGPVDEVFQRPKHPYTRALLAAIPDVTETVELESIEGQPPDIATFMAGCRFAPRCRYCRDLCANQVPALTMRGGERLARCFGTESNGWVEL